LDHGSHEWTCNVRFVHAQVRDHYSAFGRPSIDPVVLFKLVIIVEGML
jgi:hypothetical protein